MDLAEELAKWGPSGHAPRPSLAEAEAYCRRLATTHYENFSVVSWLFPRHLHQHLCNVYAYCRWADDLADEAESPAQASELLTWWEQQLPAEAETRHPVFIALRETIREKQIPLKPFRALLVAFRRDQVKTRYETWDEVLDYCEHSANPVGRLVLHLGRSASDSNCKLSDCICTGLQQINFCQDVARDYARGRIYLPRVERERFGWDDERFAAQKAGAAVDELFRQMLQEQVERAEILFRGGDMLVSYVTPELRLPVRIFVAGGRAIAQAIRQQRYDVWTRRPVVSKWRKLMLLLRALF